MHLCEDQEIERDNPALVTTKEKTAPHHQQGARPKDKSPLRKSEPVELASSWHRASNSKGPK